ncbi:ExbD/TolR family protein [Epibacterium ulvae]|uniref:ExbD/TolR family protein n=1 Tax=Epibacterium ulvae TaxID=1156985 RepID=UPI0024939F78|nr:biopolymer transporter ExbD [Epibacterium ulvae]
MIQMKRKKNSGKEPTIALINIVFLMLVFFMIAGTLAPPLDPDLQLVQTDQLNPQNPPDTLVIRADGSLWLRTIELTSIAAYMDRLSDEDRDTVRIVPDRALPAKQLMSHVGQMRREGANHVLLVTEKALR